MKDRVVQMAGYSGTPRDYRNLLKPLPANVRFEAAATVATDIVHLFETRREALKVSLLALRNTLAPQAVIWVSWPKKTSNVPTTVTENVTRELALPLGFVDVKVCAVTDVWSGLRLVLRRELR
jgi:hypothetical protein